MVLTFFPSTCRNSIAERLSIVRHHLWCPQPQVRPIPLSREDYLKGPASTTWNKASANRKHFLANSGRFPPWPVDRCGFGKTEMDQARLRASCECRDNPYSGFIKASDIPAPSRVLVPVPPQLLQACSSRTIMTWQSLLWTYLLLVQCSENSCWFSLQSQI
ncbi:hypothetical protein EDB89DRAFT_319117 [Lactarius sanguifluus]|nr:hypothetical protein EDB89DRAFT_319117 [Lactarius sanguifluus]